MIIKGRPRGNAPQLANYLLAKGENESIMLMDVDGKETANPQAFKDLLYSMELNSELTKSRKSVYHVFLNPSSEDRAMSMEEWQQSVDILAKELKMENQRRAVVLHRKLNKPAHAHIVFERYDHDQEKMVSDSHNYLAHDKAREKVEQALSHKRTPQKNANRDSHRKTLTEIWHGTANGRDFISKASELGYQIAKGTDKRPYRFIDNKGVSFDLPRYLQGANTKDVAKKLSNEHLPSEKDCIRKAQTIKQVKLNKEEIIKPNIVEANKADQRKPKETDRQAEIERLEAQRAEFIRNMKQIEERNRALKHIKNLTLSAIIVLKVTFSFKGSEATNTIAKLDHFKQAKETILNFSSETTNRRLDFIEASQFYKPT